MEDDLEGRVLEFHSSGGPASPGLAMQQGSLKAGLGLCLICAHRQGTPGESPGVPGSILQHL